MTELPTKKQNATFSSVLQQLTPARVGLGRHGAAIPTQSRLEFLAAHASARDAVYSTMSTADLEKEYGEPLLEIHSRATTRQEFLLRPDYGRAPLHLPDLSSHSAQIGIIFADGLSPHAITEHGAPLYRALNSVLTSAGYSVAAPVIARESRVALGDHIGHAAQWDITLMVIGERPGLSVPQSLGIYSTWKTKPGITEEQRNCISNIHPPEGTKYEEAAAITLDYVRKYYALEKSGFTIKAAEVRPAL